MVRATAPPICILRRPLASYWTPVYASIHPSVCLHTPDRGLIFTWHKINSHTVFRLYINCHILDTICNSNLFFISELTVSGFSNRALYYYGEVVAQQGICPHMTPARVNWAGKAVIMKQFWMRMAEGFNCIEDNTRLMRKKDARGT